MVTTGKSKSRNWDRAGIIGLKKSSAIWNGIGKTILSCLLWNGFLCIFEGMIYKNIQKIL